MNYPYDRDNKRTLEEFWNEQAQWSESVFGTTAERGPLGPLKHLRKEVEEAIADTGDTIEMIDCLFLVFDACRRAGLSYQEVVDLAFHKLEINKKRKWAKPISDEPVEHERL
jgi:hypothetical protein